MDILADFIQIRPMLAVADNAPDFRLQNQNEEWVTLKDLTSRNSLMLAFYPGDFTPVCTKQLCAYQEAYDRFVAYGVDVAGISHNSPTEHQKFIARYKFAFPLLSDPDRKVTKAYEVTSLFMLGGTSRAVYFIGKNGKVLYRYVEPTVLTHRKPEELLSVLDNLHKGKLI